MGYPLGRGDETRGVEHLLELERLLDELGFAQGNISAIRFASESLGFELIIERRGEHEHISIETQGDIGHRKPFLSHGV